MHRCQRDLAAAVDVKRCMCVGGVEAFLGRVQTRSAPSRRRLDAACTASLGDILVGPLRRYDKVDQDGERPRPGINTCPNPWRSSGALLLYCNAARKSSSVFLVYLATTAFQCTLAST
jgi:hypothetical protein